MVHYHAIWTSVAHSVQVGIIVNCSWNLWLRRQGWASVHCVVSIVVDPTAEALQLHWATVTWFVMFEIVLNQNGSLEG